MTFTLNNLSAGLIVYFLVFARVGAMVMLLPGIGQQGIPPRVRLALALAITVALAPVVAHYYPPALPTAPMAMLVWLVRETLIGIIIGGAAQIIMSALNVAGSLIALQTGLASAQALDPTQGEQSAIVGQFFSLLGVVMIFATNLHYLAIGAISGSYRLLPPGTGLPSADMAQLAIRLVSSSFALGLELAAPFIVFGFVVNASIGLLARLMPQLQVFFIALPINIMAGFLLIILLIGTLMTVFLNFYSAQMGAFL